MCVDKSTAEWSGLGDGHPKGMPHVTKMPRKPKPTFGELMTAADVETGIVIQMELGEAKEDMAGKELIAECGGMRGGAAAARLAVPFAFASLWRTVLCDSRFMSVPLLSACGVATSSQSVS